MWSTLEWLLYLFMCVCFFTQIIGCLRVVPLDEKYSPQWITFWLMEFFTFGDQHVWNISSSLIIWHLIKGKVISQVHPCHNRNWRKNLKKIGVAFCPNFGENWPPNGDCKLYDWKISICVLKNATKPTKNEVKWRSPF